MAKPKRVAGIATVYRKWSHAEIIFGKILDGYLHDGGAGPNLQLVSLYLDQIPDRDTGQVAAKKHGVRLCKTIDEAITFGGNQLAVDGVIIVGEHGKYPENEKGQTLFPRRRFFEETVQAFDRCGAVVPVFNDKHISATWVDARAVYTAAQKRLIPMMAGSSVPVSWRRPELELPIGCPLTGAVQVGYGPFEAYGFHAIEGLQCMVERRKGGETGVRAVQVIAGPEMWKAMDAGRFSRTLTEAGFDHVPTKRQGDYRDLTTRKGRDSSAIMIEYSDGLRAAVLVTNGYLLDGDGGGFAFAGQISGEATPRACQFYLQDGDPFGHFIYLVKAIDSMIQTGHPPIPIERTLLTTGILDAAMTSRHENGRRIETPELAKIRYQPSRWPFARDPVPDRVPRKK
ncbi:MAG: hypothetical protein LC104_10525 [Bacteroidales bacterium]|nr:hypothetical protein [Bacteroidales bacterium]